MRLKQRAEFVRVGKGRRVHSANMTVQAAPHTADLAAEGVESARFGLTVTNKTGNSPQRNRIRRRLREILRLHALCARADHDYVIIGRTGLLHLPFSSIAAELDATLKRLQRPSSKSGTQTLAAPASRGPGTAHASKSSSSE